jgi:hypothetical protein
MDTNPTLMLIPLESLLVIAGALLACYLIWGLLAWAGPKVSKRFQALMEAKIKFWGLELSLKGKGALIFFLLLFVLIVVLYGLLRIIPGAQ